MNAHGRYETTYTTSGITISEPIIQTIGRPRPGPEPQPALGWRRGGGDAGPGIRRPGAGAIGPKPIRPATWNAEYIEAAHHDERERRP